MSEQNLPPNILKLQKLSVSDMDEINDQLDHRLFPELGRFGKFIEAQWHDIKGNVKFWAIGFVISTAWIKYETVKQGGTMKTAAILSVYFVFWAIVIYVLYRNWCRREDLMEKAIAAQRKQEGNRLAGETMREWLKNGKNRKFRGRN